MSRIYFENRFINTIPMNPTSPTHYLIEGGRKILRNNCITISFSKNEIVRYNEGYGKIIGENPIIDGTIIKYYIRDLLTNDPIKDMDIYYSTIILSEDKIDKVNKVDQHKIITAAKHIKSYNNTKIINDTTLSFVLDIIVEKIGIRSNKLLDLKSRIINTKNTNLNVENIIQNPFLYIQEDWELFNFDKAIKIDELYKLNTPDNIKIDAWVYSFIHSRNTFYIPVKDFDINYLKNQYTIYKNSKVVSRQTLIDKKILVLKKIKHYEYITTQYLINLEKKIGDEFVSLFHDEKHKLIDEITYEEVIEEKIDEYINAFENEGSIPTLKPLQRLAVKNSLTKKLSIITGFPGTGKTTIVECIIWIRKKLGLDKNISICAPTGLAFKNMQSKIKQFGLNKDASGTLHKVIYSSFPYIANPNSKTDSEFDSDSDSDSEMKTVDAMFIDEVSMVDIFMFIEIIYWAKIYRFQLILIGDKNQLPSIGPGKILNSIIQSGLFNDNIIQLTEICRQENGALLDSIRKMATGNDYKNIIQQRDFDNETLLFRPIRYYKDGNIIKEESILKLIDDYNLNTYNSKFLCYNSDPTKPINVTTINSILQNKFNPDSLVKIKCPSWKTISFKEKDHIILKHNETQTSRIFDKKKNEYISKKEYRANGDEAVIMRYDEEKQTVILWYKDTDDSETEISVKDLYELYDLSYALTIHKSQGSQYDNIIFLIDNIYNLTKPVIFTGISRAKERCFIISDMPDFIEVQKREEEKISVFLQEFLETEIE